MGKRAVEVRQVESIPQHQIISLQTKEPSMKLSAMFSDTPEAMSRTELFKGKAR